MADFAACFARSFTSWMLMRGVRVAVRIGSLESKVICRDLVTAMRAEYSLLKVSALLSWINVWLIKAFSFATEHPEGTC